MKYSLGKVLLAILTMSLLPTLKADQTKCIHFIVKVPQATPAESQIFIAGNLPELGGWAPNGKQMYPLAPLIYQLDVTVPSHTQSLLFKVTRGSYLNEAADSWGNGMNNSRADLVEETTTVVRSIPHWKDLGPRLSKAGVKTVENFYSPELHNHRRLLIYTPPNYETDPTRRFPVMYLHDGQYFFGTDHAAPGYGLGIDEASDRLVKSGEMEPTILVGIGNTLSRDDEYDYEVQGKTYARFVIDTVKTYIDQHFRTLADRRHTSTLGMSLGASIAVDLMWRYPEVFSAAGGLSLPVFNQNSALLKLIENDANPKLPFRLYFDHGDQGQDSGYEGSAKRFYRALQTRGVSLNWIHYRTFPYADHSSLDWARRLDEPLKFLSSERCSGLIEGG